MIELKNIGVTFGKGTPLEHRVFKDLSLKIDNGQFVTIIGGNGAGKSTLMNVISGEVIADKGEVILDDQKVTQLLPHERAALIARVFQDPLLGTYGDLTIEENLSLAYCRGKTRDLKSAVTKALREHFKGLLKEMHLGLEKRLSDKMAMLSGGQRQAVSLLMAVLQPAKILLLDEHTANLDPKMEAIILDLTQRLIIEKQLTALMITHSMSQALAYGTRTLVLYQGKVVEDLLGAKRKALKATDLTPYF